jgi:hypothetical protein
VIAVGQFRFESLREASPCIRQVKKQHLVGGIGDQLCQPQALGAIESISFRSHPPPHYSTRPTDISATRTLWRRFRSVITPHQLAATGRNVGFRTFVGLARDPFDKGQLE